MKNLGFEDKGIKKMLAEGLEEEFSVESSVRVAGSSGAAVVTKSEKFEVKGEAEEVDKVIEAVKKGLIVDAVKLQQVINVPVADRERAASILQAAGIAATVSVKLDVEAKGFRAFVNSESSSVEEIEAKASLKKVVDSSVSYRVKYEKA
jgi:hypothetical protein